MILAISWIKCPQTSVYSYDSSAKGAQIGERRLNAALSVWRKMDFSNVHFVNMDRRLLRLSRSCIYTIWRKGAVKWFCSRTGVKEKGAKETWKRGGSGGFVLGCLYMACCTREMRVFRSTRHPSDVQEVLQADGQIKGLLPNYRLSVKKKANVLTFRPQSSTRPVYV